MSSFEIRIKQAYTATPQPLRVPSSISSIPKGLRALNFQHTMIVENITNLIDLGLIVEKRPNPKQRKKLKEKFQQQLKW